MSRRKTRPPEQDAAPRARAHEQLLIDAIPELPPGRVLCTSLGRGLFAYAAAAARADDVVCSFLDLFARDQSRSVAAESPSNLRLECAADFPAEEFDAVAMPVRASGEAELVRDQLQSGHQRLRVGGTMMVATDNSADTWLHDELRKIFPKVTRQPGKRGTFYRATKTEPLRKEKNFECRFAFRDEGRLIQAVSRPGVFSHRHVDGGARALLKAAAVKAGDRVLEIGCGSGVVSMALALRAPDVTVDAIDSNARAVQCTQLGLEANSITNVNAHLSTAESAIGTVGGARFDLVVANAPYYSNYRIAEIFTQCAADALTESGTALFVAKRTKWYVENLPRWFASVGVETLGEYQIVRAARISSAASSSAS